MDSLKKTAFAAVILLICACGPREQPVKIAVAAPLTGDLGTEGQGLLRAVALAVEEANAARRFPFRLEAEPFDDRADPDEAANVANLIIADPRIVAVIGHYNSGCALRAARVYAGAPLAMVTPSATTPQLTSQQLRPDWRAPRVVFRVCPTDDVEGTYAATFAFERLRRPRVCIVHDTTPYGTGLAEEFRKTYAKLGGRVLSDEPIAPGKRDFGPLLAKIKALEPGAVYFGGVYTEAGLIVKAMRAAGMKEPFIAGDGVQTPGFFDVAGDDADGAYLTTVGVPVDLIPGARRFMDDYRRRWIGADEGLRPFDHYGYEAAQIVFDALDRAGPEARYDRSRVISELKRTRHEGLLGITRFDAKGDTLNKIITMTRARAKDRAFPAAQ